MYIIGKSMDVFLAGGPIMYIILLCSLIVVAIFIERYLYYRNLVALPAYVLPDLADKLSSGAYRDAMRLCEDVDCPATQVAAAGISCFPDRSARMESAMDNEALVVMGRLRRNIGHLSSIVTLAPLLGLLGTVIGMMNSFQVMNIKSGEPAAITGGVGEALTATAFGLFVAIFAMAAYSYFTHRLDKIAAGIEEITALIVRTAK